MASAPTSRDGKLLVFDLIASHEGWNVQALLVHIEERLASNNIDISSFPSKVSLPNLTKQRTLFNNAAYRKKTRLACTRYRQQVGCDRSINLLDFFYPAPNIAQPSTPHPADPRRNDKRKIDTLQKRLRRMKSKFDLLKRQYVELSKETKSASEKRESNRREVAKKLKNSRRQSKLKSRSNSSHRATIATMRKLLNKCVEFVNKKQRQEMKTMLTAVGANEADFLNDYDLTDEENDRVSESRDAKLRRLLIIQHQKSVNRDAVRQFCKAFDDCDVNAGRLESKWRQCRKDVVGLYKLEVTSKLAIDKKAAERVYVFVADFDNYLTQIITLEGLPSTAIGDAEEKSLWLRIGGDGRSIHRHSNNILIVMALMDPANPRRSHAPLFVHTMMLIDGDESHDLLADSLHVLDEWISKLGASGFMYGDELYKVNIVLTGDMKFVQLVKGLQGATSVFSCPLCLKPKQPKMPSRGPRPWGGFRCACDSVEGADPCEHWSGAGVSRNQTHATEMAEAGGDCWSHMGHHKQAPLKSIEWGLIILDTLHGLLRITDVIFGSLYEWARRSCEPLDKAGLMMVSRSVVY
jgi:hypothetical protein